MLLTNLPTNLPADSFSSKSYIWYRASLGCASGILGLALLPAFQLNSMGVQLGSVSTFLHSMMFCSLLTLFEIDRRNIIGLALVVLFLELLGEIVAIRMWFNFDGAVSQSTSSVYFFSATFDPWDILSIFLAVFLSALVAVLTVDNRSRSK